MQLDTLHPFIVEMLQMITNSAANSLLMEQQCDVEVGPRMEDQTRIAFITRKYVKKEWAVSSEVPDPFESIKRMDFLGLFHALNFGRAEDRYEGLTPLHAAVQSGESLLVTIAALCQTDIDVLDTNGWTPLCYALFYGENDIAKFLIGLGANPAKAQIDIGLLAVYNGEKELIENVLGNSKTDSDIGIFRPVSGSFAAGKNAVLTEIVIPQVTKQVYRMYRDLSLG
jgi:hypothetical protein